MANTELKNQSNNYFDESENNVCNRKIALPVFENKFPFKRNPIHESPQVEDWIKWCFTYSQMTSEQFRKVKNSGLYGALFYPFCDDIKRYENIVKLMIMFIAVDDHSESNHGQMLVGNNAVKNSLRIKQMFVKFENKQFIPMTDWPPYVTGLFASFEPILQSFNPIQRKRMTDSWCDFMDGYIEESKFKAHHKGFNSVEEYLQIRRKAIGTNFCIQLIEYADQIFVPEHVWHHPNIQHLFDLIALQFMCVHDMISFNKEYIENKMDLVKMFNMVAVISLTDNIPIKESMDRVVANMREYESEIFTIESRIQSDDNCLPETKLLIERCNYILGGNYALGYQLDRYTNMDLYYN